MEMFALMGFIPILFYLGMLGFGIYFGVTVLTLMKQRNNHLKELIVEVRKRNNSL